MDEIALIRALAPHDERSDPSARAAARQALDAGIESASSASSPKRGSSPRRRFLALGGAVALSDCRHRRPVRGRPGFTLAAARLRRQARPLRRVDPIAAARRAGLAGPKRRSVAAELGEHGIRPWASGPSRTPRLAPRNHPPGSPAPDRYAYGEIELGPMAHPRGYPCMAEAVPSPWLHGHGPGAGDRCTYRSGGWRFGPGGRRSALDDRRLERTRPHALAQRLGPQPPGFPREAQLAAKGGRPNLARRHAAKGRKGRRLRCRSPRHASGRSHPRGV